MQLWWVWCPSAIFYYHRGALLTPVLLLSQRFRVHTKGVPCWFDVEGIAVAWQDLRRTVGWLLACCSHLASKRSMIDMIGRVKDSMWQSYFAKLSCWPLMLLQEQIFLGTWITLITILDECFARHEAWSAGQNLSLSCTILRGDLSKLCRNQIAYLRHTWHTAARFVFLRRVF